MLKVGGEAAVARDDRPAVVEHVRALAALRKRDHRLDRDRHAGPQHELRPRLAEVGDFWVLVDGASDAVSDPVAHDAKARILRISAESPHKDELRQLLVTDDPARLTELDSLSYAWAEKYIDRSGEWMNLVDIGRQIGVDYGTILSNMSRNYAEIEDGTGRLCLIYFVDYMRSGQQAPLEFCRQSIQETLISMRKRRLILDLERDLLEQARQNGDFVIYEDQK